ncbi:Transposase IS4 [Popillia japonica]|uniref:Transposase IS4 n=1 Tax=Popillia japonica TaxID=7064 RepID=A0AAW1JHX0_POPJA
MGSKRPLTEKELSKRPLTEKELEYHANLSDSEFDEIFGEAGDDRRIWRQNGPVTVCKWKDKRDVLTISNMHSVEMVEVSNRNGKVSMKPNIIRDYNKGMSGVDRSDQMLSYYTSLMLSYYTSLRKTIRWPKKSSKMKLIKFREEFVVALIGEEIQSVSKKNRLQDLHYLESLPPTGKKQRPTKPCRICTQGKKRRETRLQQRNVWR